MWDTLLQFCYHLDNREHCKTFNMCRFDHMEDEILTKVLCNLCATNTQVLCNPCTKKNLRIKDKWTQTPNNTSPNREEASNCK